MKVKEFNKLKKDAKAGNVKGLKDEIIKQLTLKQAQALEDLLMDLELTEEMNKVLDELVNHINNKVANKKAPSKTEKGPEKAPSKTEKEPEKAPEKAPEKPKNGKIKKLTDTVEVGDIVKFRVEGEEIEHPIRIIYKSKYDIIAISKDEKEVFKIRKTDFNKQVFEWRDRHGEEYNIIVSL